MVVQVAAGVGDVGAPCQPEGVDRQVRQASEDSGGCTGPDLGSVLVEGDITSPMQTDFHRPVLTLVVVEVCGAGELGREPRGLRG